MSYSLKDIYKYPVWISWELTTMCNYKCIHCRMDEINDYPKELTYEEAINCIDEFSSLGVYQINFSGGEPFLRNDFLELLEYTSKKGIKIGITTNGSLITDTVVDKLRVIKNIDYIQVSIDGKDSITHDYIRGVNGAFDKAIDAIKRLLNGGIRTGAVTTVMGKNVDQIERIANMLTELGVKTYGARRFMPTGKGNRLRDSLMVSKEEYKKHCEYWVKQMSENSKGMQFIIEEPLLAIMKDKLPNNWKTNGCLGGSVYGAMTADGDVRLCIFIPFKLGNVREKSFQEIWDNSKTGEKIADRDLKGKCGSCEHKVVCGGCRAAAYLHYNDLLHEDPMCFL